MVERRRQRVGLNNDRKFFMMEEVEQSGSRRVGEEKYLLVKERKILYEKEKKTGRMTKI